MVKNYKIPSDSILHNYVQTQKNLMNEKRIRILLLLDHHSTTWSELMQTIDIRNPKLLQDHLTALTSSNLINKNKDGFYELTKTGKIFLDINLFQINQLSKHGTGKN